jgi:hypothetical protein
MRTKETTKQRHAERSFNINDELRKEYDIVMLDDLDIIDEVALAEVLEDED